MVVTSYALWFFEAIHVASEVLQLRRTSVGTQVLVFWFQARCPFSRCYCSSSPWQASSVWGHYWRAWSVCKSGFCLFLWGGTALSPAARVGTWSLWPLYFSVLVSRHGTAVTMSEDGCHFLRPCSLQARWKALGHRARLSLLQQAYISFSLKRR